MPRENDPEVYRGIMYYIMLIAFYRRFYNMITIKAQRGSDDNVYMSTMGSIKFWITCILAGQRCRFAAMLAVSTNLTYPIPYLSEPHNNKIITFFGPILPLLNNTHTRYSGFMCIWLTELSRCPFSRHNVVSFESFT